MGKCCEHSSAYIFDRIFFILAGNEDSHKISNEFEIRVDSTIYNGKDVVNTPALSFLIRSSSFLQVTRTTLRSRMSSIFSKIRPWAAELPALERFWKMAVKCCEHSRFHSQFRTFEVGQKFQY